MHIVNDLIKVVLQTVMGVESGKAWANQIPMEGMEIQLQI